MVFTHGMFAAIAFVAFPLSIMAGGYVLYSLQQIFRALPNFNFPSFLALLGIALFAAECVLFFQFRRLDRNYQSFRRPVFLWSASIAAFILWIAWFYACAVVVHWHYSPDFLFLSLAFVLWPFTGFVLSSVALCSKLRRV